MKSILQTEKECYVCKTTQSLQLHHIFFGRNRKRADKEGCTCYLCQYHHTGSGGVHNNRELDLKLKKLCEARWLEYYSKGIDDFIERYGKNYL